MTPDSIVLIPGLAALVLEAPLLVLEEFLLEWEGLQRAHHALVVRADLADDLARLQDALELPTGTANQPMRWRWALLHSQGRPELALAIWRPGVLHGVFRRVDGQCLLGGGPR